MGCGWWAERLLLGGGATCAETSGRRGSMEGAGVCVFLADASQL